MPDLKQATPQRRLGRSLLAVFAGLIVIFAVTTGVDAVLHGTGVFPPPGQPMATALWLLAMGYRLVIAIAGCALAARLAPYRPMTHAMVLGWIGVVLSTLGVIATWGRGPGFGPVWYPISLVVTALPCAWLGGRLGSPAASVARAEVNP